MIVFETGATIVAAGKTLHCAAGVCSETPPPPPDPRYWPGRSCFYKKGHEFDPKYGGCQPESFWDTPPEVLEARVAKGELPSIVIRPYTKTDETWQRQTGGAEMAAAFAYWDQLPAPTAATAASQQSQATARWKMGYTTPPAYAEPSPATVAMAAATPAVPTWAYLAGGGLALLLLLRSS